ncbi:MAG: gluconokinase [Candidatus Thermoplasmatota archaeon]|jgi:hypothetical protein|nr:gluconokinase [Candidatus Thermoplasmatota archaeon]
MVTAERLIRELKKPRAYPDPVGQIKFVQTHISWVFITERFAYKVKKPVNFGFLDFSTLEKRNFYCHREIELNKRLAPEVYLGVCPVTEHNGSIRIMELGVDSAEFENTQKEDVVEYCVKMKRIPDNVLMRTAFDKGGLGSKDLINIARTIAEFHRTARGSGEIDHFGTLDVVKFNTDENFEQTREFVDRSISMDQYEAIKNWTGEFYRKHIGVFKERIRSKKIRDCHGDLHMEHVCLTEPISIIDCIEFNDRFRYSDTASDIAFLIMDLEYNHGEDLAAELYLSYLEHSNETDVELFDLLLNFYKVYRSYVRGKVISFQLNDPDIPEEGKALAAAVAGKYFELACKYIIESD